MFSCSSTRLVTIFLGSSILVSLTRAAAPPQPRGVIDASTWFPKAAGAAGFVNNTYDRGAYDTSDGCPVGWVECSADTCYPLDGSACCSDGNFCPAGTYCDGGGCCPNGTVCSGSAPPPSTIEVGPTTTAGTTSTRRTGTTSTFVGFSTASTSTSGLGAPTESVPFATSTSVSVGYSAPAQSTDYGTVTMPAANTSSTQTSSVGGLPTNSNTATDKFASSPASSPTGSGLHSGAVEALPTSYIRTSVWLAGVVAVAMCMA